MIGIIVFGNVEATLRFLPPLRLHGGSHCQVRSMQLCSLDTLNFAGCPGKIVHGECAHCMVSLSLFSCGRLGRGVPQLCNKLVAITEQNKKDRNP